MTDNISRLYRLNNIDKVFYVSDTVFEDGYDLNSIKEDYPPFSKSCIDIDENDYIHLSHMKQILQKCEVIDE